MKCLIVLVCCLATTFAQYGPAPPRLAIPGALPIGPGPPGQGRAIPGQQQFRRPNRPQPVVTEARFYNDEAKPVSEDDDDYPHQPVQPAPPRALFTSEPQDHEPPQRPKPVQRNFPPQQQQQPQRPRVQSNFHDDRHQKPHQSEDKPKKPVAQILRKYREENPDGSITWGFENDDGSFKEETIGIDCITRGVYGYIDPDGEKREYRYETGILCDPDKKDQDDEEDIESEDYIANHRAAQQAKRPHNNRN